MRQQPGGFGVPAAGQPGRYGPWTSGQVRLAGEWSARRDQLVSIALAPAGDRLAHSVGPRLSVSGIADGPRVEYRLPVTCALSPALTWSPAGDKLAFRDDSGQGRVADLSGPLPAAGAQSRIPFLGSASALAFVPGDERLVALAPSLPGRMTLRLIRPGGDAIWERALPRNRMSGSRLEGVNLAVSPDGSRVACTAGTPTVVVFDTATGQPVRQFDGHSQTVTGLAWIDDEWIVTAAADATLQVWRPDDAAPALVVETVAAAGMTFVRERRTALVWSARGDLRAWSLAQTPTQLWYRDPPPRSLAAHFTSLAVSAVGEPAGAGRCRIDGPRAGQRLGPRGRRSGRDQDLRERQGLDARRLRGRQVGFGHGAGGSGLRAHRIDARAPDLAAPRSRGNRLRR